MTNAITGLILTDTIEDAIIDAIFEHEGILKFCVYSRYRLQHWYLDGRRVFMLMDQSKLEVRVLKRSIDYIVHEHLPQTIVNKIQALPHGIDSLNIKYIAVKIVRMFPMEIDYTKPLRNVRQQVDHPLGLVTRTQ